MSLKDKIDNSIIDIDTRLQRVRNDIDKIENVPPSNRANFQNEIKKQLDIIHSKIVEIKSGSSKLPAQFLEFYRSEVKNLFTRHRQLLSDFKKVESLPIQPEQPPKPLSPFEQKVEHINQQFDETIENQVEMVSKILDKKLKKIENRLQHARNDLERLDQCLPSQRINFQNEIKMQLDTIQSKISKVANSSRSLPPDIASNYNNKINLLSSQHQKLVSDLKNKETPTNYDTQIQPISEVMERAVNIESINDIIEQNEELPEKKCFNPCMKNYIIWPIVALLFVALGFSLFWKLKK